MKQNTQKQVKEIKVESPTRKRLILIGKRFSEKKRKWTEEELMEMGRS